MAVVPGRRQIAQVIAGPTASPDAYGAQQGRALDNVGRAIEDVGDRIGARVAQERSVQREIDAKRREIELSKQLRTATTEYLSTQSSASVDGWGAHQERLKKIAGGVTEGVTDELVKAELELAAQTRLAAAEDSGYRHFTNQRGAYRTELASTRITEANEDLLLNPGSAAVRAQSERTILAEVNELSRIQGWDQETLAAQRREALSGARGGAVATLAKNDLVAAQTLYDASKAEMSAKHREEAEKALREAKYVYARDTYSGDPEGLREAAKGAGGKPGAGLGENSQRVYAAIVSAGYPAHVAAGMVGNFLHEGSSGGDIDPAINELKPTVPGSRGGLGIAQWTGERRKALEQFAAERDMNPASIEVQTQYLLHELETTESKAALALRNATSAEEAAAIFEAEFERPGVKSTEKRQAAARKVLEAYDRGARDPLLTGLGRDDIESLAREFEREQAAVFRDDAPAHEDRLAALRAGQQVEGEIPDREAMRRKYGRENAAELDAQYRQAAKIGAVAGDMRGATMDEAVSIVEQATNDLGAPGSTDYQRRAEYAATVVQAYNDRVEALIKDPAGYFEARDAAVKREREAWRSGDAEALGRLINRNIANQEAREIPKAIQRPLSASDAQFIGATLNALPPEQLGPAIAQLEAGAGKDQWKAAINQMIDQKVIDSDYGTFARFADDNKISRFLFLGLGRSEADAGKHLPDEGKISEIYDRLEQDYSPYLAAVGAGDADVAGTDAVIAEMELAARSAAVYAIMHQNMSADKAAAYASEQMLSHVSVANTSDVLAYAPKEYDADMIESVSGVMMSRLQDSDWTPERYQGAHANDVVNRNLQVALLENNARFITREDGEGVVLAVPLGPNFEVVVDADGNPYGFSFADMESIYEDARTSSGDFEAPTRNLTANPELQDSPVVRSE